MTQLNALPSSDCRDIPGAELTCNGDVTAVIMTFQEGKTCSYSESAAYKDHVFSCR
jgi:hypothetical protein